MIFDMAIFVIFRKHLGDGLINLNITLDYAVSSVSSIKVCNGNRKTYANFEQIIIV